MEWSTSTNRFRLINGLTGDPGLFVHFLRTGEGILFDLGSLERLNHKDLLKVKRVFITHTHMDHFIGFDRLLRLNVARGLNMEFCGPPGLARNVQGKLRGYIWNLVESDQIAYTVREINGTGEVSSYEISNADDFEIHPTANLTPIAGAQVRPLSQSPAAFLTNLDDGSRIEAVCVDHGIPSVAYLCQSDLRFRVKTAELNALNLKPGPWITELQTKTSAAQYDHTIEINGQTWRVGELSAEILTYDAPRPVAYLTDLQFSWANLNRLKSLMQDVECLVCESNFSQSDFKKAFAKKHLTAKQAALIAAFIGAEALQIFHISKLYRSNPQAIVDEAAKHFEMFRNLDEDAMCAAIDAEVARKN